MKKLTPFLLAILMFSALAGCKRMLEIQPNDRLLEQSIYKDRKSIYGVLNGIYNSMAGANLYGEKLTLTIPDLLAQYYIAYPFRYAGIAEGDYTGSDVRTIIDPVWSEAYNLILQNNILMRHVTEDNNNGLSEDDRQILSGETHAIRAFIHFDLLRLFGPVYSIAPGTLTIPYNTSEVQQTQKILSASEVAALIKKDLDSAALYLKNDPVITKGITNDFNSETGDNFMQRRHLRLNYFAVRALQARVMLYTGNKQAAGQYAREVISNTGSIFRWSPAEASLPGGQDQDLTFSPEIIFGLFNNSLYNSYYALFAPINSSVLMPEENGLLTFYERNSNDFRYRGWWRLDATGVQKTRTFFKYVNPNQNPTTGPIPVKMYFQPLIRISELYYIAAETEPDPVAALNYLNAVRINRGLVRLTATANLEKEIENEYRKEMWGEGQLFYYYKRKNLTTIPTTAGTTTTTSFNAKRYRLPLPLSESLNR